MNVQIVSYNNKHQADIDQLLESILLEFDLPARAPKNPLVLPDAYWVAEFNGKAIGTIALFNMKNRSVVLKKMFVSKEFRGKGISKMLLDTLFKWARENNFARVYLGTMTEFKAAHRFYEKNGFKKIERKNLPRDFPINPVDPLYYTINLTD